MLDFTRPGVREYEVEAEFQHEFVRHGGRFAYPPIIGSGRNACCLHYLANDQVCREGELLLMDVGAAYANYNSDMTRTIPVDGRFTSRQRDVYNAVLRVMRQSTAGLIPGKKVKDWQKECEQLIEAELVNLKLITPREITMSCSRQAMITFSLWPAFFACAALCSKCEVDAKRHLK